MRFKIGNLLLFFSMSVLLPAVAQTAATCAKEIKIATIAPPGSAWDQITTALNDELKQKTGGKVCFRVYAGGVQGDEKTVIQKMRINQLQAGGLTGFGLGIIAPAVRVLELPFLLKDTAAIDATVSKLTPALQQALAKGSPSVELLGWAEAGYVYIMSNKPIAKIEDIKGVKMWTWEGDPVAAALANAFSVTPIQLSIVDVMTSLQTGMIDAVYAPPLGALALQWSSKVKYLTNLPLTNSIGALVMLKSEFNKLPADQRAAVKEISAKYCRQIVTRTRSDNEQAMAKLKQLGIQVVEVVEADKQKFIEGAKTVWDGQVGKLYSSDLLAQAKTASGN